MNGKVAKKIRRMVFGDLARSGAEYETNDRGMRIAIGKRKEYKEAKKAYRKNKA